MVGVQGEVNPAKAAWKQASGLDPPVVDLHILQEVDELLHQWGEQGLQLDPRDQQLFDARCCASLAGERLALG